MRVCKTSNVWESGNWVISLEVANDCIGGDIYFHSSQSKESYFGGEILSATKIMEGFDQGRFVFKFKATMVHKGIKTSKEGWGMEKKIVRDALASN